MTTLLPVSEAKQHLGALVDRAHLQHELVSLSKRGRRVAVLVDADDFDRMVERLEEIDDAQAAIAARREVEETAAEPIPWDDVKRELGLT
ncbi:type II toxin-antitoxin system Phd/YefM family antitoxin [Leifsonia sp. TF02-11]|uniref:type II toxin-antitoxin system Phd/YefM family antitoxin n=1 Tax=Leifsonia sp. TF02-11 TaxID=2815212 RepID=UPI001AA1657C|nr:type II toxin-antitoxin system Phd/YefM family antitoxin [Leifsonia sp. TF02-11]MBO1739262.1 type II toxin-antitoxin system Phd/YefM family antitoxin [Leifsonia sp. TF02-11]